MVKPASAGSMMPQNGFQKCGEVLTAIEVGEQKKIVFALNCIFCTTICLQLESFALHVEEYHRDRLDSDELDEKFETLNDEEFLPETEQDSPALETQSFEDVTETMQADDIKYTHVIQESKVYEDPLEQPPPLIVTQKDCTNVDDDVKTEYKAETIGSDSDGNAEDVYEHVSEAENCCDKSDSSEIDSNYDTDTEEGCSGPPDDQLDHEEDKEITLAIIAGYEKQRLLWDVNERNAKNRKKREEARRKIAQLVNKRCGVNIQASDVCDRIRKIRYKFRSDLQNQKLAESRGETHTPLWYYNQLAFLDTVIKYKQRNKRGAKALSNEKPALPLSSLSEAQNLELIAIYKSFPCLWDVQHIGFRFKQQRQDTLLEMLEAIKTRMSLEFTSEELQKKLYRIRYACTQAKHRKLQCEHNREEFKTSCKYYEQIAFLEDNVGPFKCPYCEMKFNGADQYRIHKAKHDGSMPFTCPLCNRGFMKVGNCTVHLRRHTRDYSFECKECGKRYATSTDLNVHMRYHTGEKPYFCEICGQSFRTWTFFDAHMRRHQKRPSHNCTICAKAFYEKNKLNEHMKAHLNVRDKECNVCGKAFTSAKYLRQHKQIHAEKKKYICKICGKDFAQYAGLSGHMKSHGTTVSGAIAIAEDNL